MSQDDVYNRAPFRCWSAILPQIIGMLSALALCYLFFTDQLPSEVLWVYWAALALAVIQCVTWLIGVLRCEPPVVRLCQLKRP